ncbi:hypothetical protein GCM10011529_29290 [Polymorphobacter glacialis]|uniref:Flagellar biosynthetic protein FliO n=1 Tax=Sandarakinorhabdus glacialis TaxID=1614636 RepID=A0A917A1B1_9SPHN|nr:flagellar biosynthetic protein FliO [Polymorphobacter glacialis]GGE20815.1 hypothetical protein GCM10011529_29290 [Polymorphobacter glacialis]
MGNWVEKLRAKLPRGLGDAPRFAKVVQALPLGPGSRLLVVEFGGRRLLIGQARTGLVRLGEAQGADLGGE